jgi:hypothetical protein
MLLLIIFIYYKSEFKIWNLKIVNSPSADSTNNMLENNTINSIDNTANNSTSNSNNTASNSNEDTTLNSPEPNSPQNSLGDTNTLGTSDPQLIIDTINQIPTKESLRLLPSGTIINLDDSGDYMNQICFYYEEITEDIKNRITGISYGEDCTVPLEDLRYVRVLYYGFDEQTHIGELIVNTAIAGDIVDIFLELYEIRYPIGQMVLVDDYNADDNSSMAANNSSSFNYRTVPGSTYLSKHALGLAIDINPLYNPYVLYSDSETIVLPIEGKEYEDRSLECSYFIKENDPCYEAFTKRGFTWGGFWKTSPDYQHFQKVVE